MSTMRYINRLRKAVRLSRHSAYRKGLRQGVGAAIEHENALRPLVLAALVDVGANKGQFSLMTRALFPNAVIHAFEPLDEAAGKFRALFAGDSGVTLHQMALGEEAGTAEIHVSGHADSSSLLPITARQNELFPGTASIGTQTIVVARGDDVLGTFDLPRPLMIKLDVQGFELSALRGLPRMLARADFVYVEVSFVELYANQSLADEVIAFLRSQGFRLTGIYNLATGPGGMSVQADALFTRTP